ASAMHTKCVDIRGRLQVDGFVQLELELEPVAASQRPRQRQASYRMAYEVPDQRARTEQAVDRRHGHQNPAKALGCRCDQWCERPVRGELGPAKLLERVIDLPVTVVGVKPGRPRVVLY